MIEYSPGFDETITALRVFGWVLAGGYLLYWLLYLTAMAGLPRDGIPAPEWRGIWLRLFASLLVFPIVGAVILTCSFVALYPLVNLSLQWSQVSSAVREELASGVLGLRVASVLVSLKAMRDLVSSLRSLAAKRRRLYSPLTRRPPGVPPQLEKWVAALGSFSQTTVFVLVMSALWLFLIDGIHAPEVTLLNWALFFFIDDWLVMAGYYSSFGGRLLATHWLRILICDLAIVVLMGRLLLAELAPLTAVLALAFLVALVGASLVVTFMAANRPARGFD